VHESKQADRQDDRLAEAIELHARVLYGLVKRNNNNAILDRLAEMENKIMATQAELSADLKLVLEQQQKTAAEIASVQAAQTVAIEKIAELEAIIAAGVNPSQELVDAVAAVKAQAQIVDELIPDLPVVIPPTEPTV